MIKDLGNGYEIEEDVCYGKANLYLWKNKNEIVGAWLDIPKQLIKKYEKRLMKDCGPEGKRNYRIQYNVFMEKKALEILEIRGEKITRAKIDNFIKNLIKEEIEEDGEVIKEKDENIMYKIKDQLKRDKAMRKFGYIISDEENQEIKNFVYKENHGKHLWEIINENLKYSDLLVLAYWSRSIAAGWGSNTRYNLFHPSFEEYKQYFEKKDVFWMKKGFSYVDIEKYKIWKKTNKSNGYKTYSDINIKLYEEYKLNNKERR